MRKGAFSSWGFQMVIVAVLAVVVGIALLGLHLGWLQGWDLNTLLVEPVNNALPIWVPFDAPNIFP